MATSVIRLNERAHQPLAPARTEAPAAPRIAIVKPREASSAPASLLEQRISEEVALAGRQIDYLASLLSKDPVFRLRYASFQPALQAMCRDMGELSRIIAAADKDDAIDRAGPELRGRLLRKALSPILG